MLCPQMGRLPLALLLANTQSSAEGIQASGGAAATAKESDQGAVRSKVEPVFRVMKRQFGFDRVRYRGLAKNANRMFACFALVNLYIARKRLVPLGA